MVVLGASIDAQSGQGGAADGGIGNHSLYGELHCLFRLLRHQGVIADSPEVADIAGVAVIILLGQLIAGLTRLFLR